MSLETKAYYFMLFLKNRQKKTVTKGLIKLTTFLIDLCYFCRYINELNI